MKNKKTIWIVTALVVLAIVIALLVLKPFGARNGETGDPQTADEAQTAASGQQTDAQDPASGEIAAADEGSSEEEASAPQLIETEGDIEIIIPDDQGSDGF